MLKHITYGDYLYLKNRSQVDTLSKYIKPNKLIQVNGSIIKPKFDPLITLPFGVFIDLTNPSLLEKYKALEMPKLFIPELSFPRLYKGLGLSDVHKLKYHNVVAVLHWFSKELEAIRQWETNIFGAGNKEDKMSKFGVYNLIQFVTGGDILAEDKILDIPYRHILIYAEYKLRIS